MNALPYSPQNCRLLLRAIYWAAAKEDEMKKIVKEENLKFSLDMLLGLGKHMQC